MKKEEYYESFCTGCGLCKSAFGYEMAMNDKGFTTPKIQNPDLLKELCPVNGRASSDAYTQNVWGPVLEFKLGWSLNPTIRKKASSGGLLTEIACWFLEKNLADGVLQTRVDENDPVSTRFVCSETSQEVIDSCGSRYAESFPLIKIDEYLKKDKKYVFVGKPCDVEILRSYIDLHDEYKDKIVCFLSFFCAGVPSRAANLELVQKMGCDYEKLKAFDYRGNGWPGYATAVDSDENIYTMDYESSWGKVLGRDKRKFCRLCMDGIGLFADIVCCDAWYEKENSRPDFSEHEGRNAVMVRTQRGKQIMDEIIKENKIHLEEDEEYRKRLNKIQKYQYSRRTTYISQWLALKLTFHSTPHMNFKNVLRLAKLASTKTHINIFWGTLKRIYRGRYK